MAPTQELNAAELARVVELLHEQILAAVDDGLHHHVDLAALPLHLDNLPALINGRCGRNGAGDMLAGPQCRDRLWSVVCNWRVDMNGVDVRVCQERLVIRVAGLHPEPVAAVVELLPIAPADRVHFGGWMPLVNRDELRTEAEAHNCDTNLLLHCLLRGASPLGLPHTLSREPLRRLAPVAWLASLRSLASIVNRGRRGL